MTLNASAGANGPLTMTIITICLDQAQFVERTLRSVIDQGYDQLQYVVLDGGSTDGSRKIIQKYAEHLHAVFEADRGPADALNKGLDLAKGEIIGYLNADDVLLPGALRTVAGRFEQNPHLDVLIGDGFEIDADGAVTHRLFSAPWSLSAFKYGQCPVVQPATFFRRSALSGGTRFNIDNRTCWDAEFLVDLALKGARIRNISVRLAGFRLHSNSISGSGRFRAQYIRDSDRLSSNIPGRKWGPLHKVLRLIFMIRRIALRPQFLLRRLGQ